MCIYTWANHMAGVHKLADSLYKNILAQQVPSAHSILSSFNSSGGTSLVAARVETRLDIRESDSAIDFYFDKGL